MKLSLKWALVAAPAIIAALLLGRMALRGTDQAIPEHALRVSQRGRQFSPSRIVIQRGDVVDIVNDDADFTHHAYVDATGFSFDSADQQPGKSVQIHFTRAGEFDVLCGIHPKMRLNVIVK